MQNRKENKVGVSVVLLVRKRQCNRGLIPPSSPHSELLASKSVCFGWNFLIQFQKAAET